MTSKKQTAKSYFKKALKPPKAFWEWCYSQLPVYEWSNSEETIRTAERENSPVIQKRLRKNSKLTLGERFYSFAIILVTKKRIEIQSYGFWRDITAGKETLLHEFVNLEVFAKNKHIKVTRCGITEFLFGLSCNYSAMGGAYERTTFFPNNWQEKVRTISEIKYLNMTAINRHTLHYQYLYRNEIEFLQKINSTKLANEIMYPDYVSCGESWLKTVDMRIITRNWLKENKPFLKNKDINFIEYEFERRIALRNGKLIPEIKRRLRIQDLSKIPKGISITKFQQWFLDTKASFSYYLDYLNTLKDIGVDPRNDDLVSMPKDLVKAHDNAVDTLNQLKREVEQAEYQERLRQLLPLEKELGEYLFMVPKELNEIIQEGKALRHCVGGSSYLKRHKTGATTIIFVRRKSAPTEPYFTIELRNKKIIQIQGKRNKETIPEEVNQATDNWLDYLRQQKLDKVS